MIKTNNIVMELIVEEQDLRRNSPLYVVGRFYLRGKRKREKRRSPQERTEERER